MKRLYRALIVFCACTLGITALSANASAQQCSNLNSDPMWAKYQQEMNDNFQAQNYEKALDAGKQLILKCDRHPIVNFTVSETYRNLGDMKNAAVYAEKATANLVDYPNVPMVVQERMWMRRAEYELPFKGELEELKVKTADYDEIKSKYEALLAVEHEAEIRGEYEQVAMKERNAKMAEETKHAWTAGLWSGVGILVGGVALTVAGGVMALKVDKIEYKRSDDSKYSGFSVKSPYVTSFGLMGAGAALSVTGAILTGISGYKLNHLDVDVDGDGAKDEAVSFSVSPTAVQFGMTF